MFKCATILSKYLDNPGNMVGMDKSDMDMDMDMDMDIDMYNPGMDMDMDMNMDMDMDMDSKAVSHSINKGLQQKAADFPLHHVQSDETRHALGSHDDHDHRILAQHDRGQYDQVLQIRVLRFRDRHDRDLRREFHLLVDEILALLVSSSSRSLTFLYS